MSVRDASHDVVVQPTPAETAVAAAREIVHAASEAVDRQRRFVIALAGGETPRLLYTLLADQYRSSLPWDRTDVCFGDERCVPPHNPASNFRLAWSTLLGQVPISEQRVHRIFGELGPDAAARDYDARLRRLFDDNSHAPTFDVALLGVGADGHTASLFPGDAALEERSRWAVAALAPPGMKSPERVTVTLRVLNRARVALFLCTGAEKREVVSRILSGAATELPAARVHGAERTLWVLDRAAAA